MAVGAQKLDQNIHEDAVNPLRTSYGAAACVALSAISYFLVIGFVGLWPISLFAPLPILALASSTKSWRMAAIASFAVFFIGYLGWWSSESFFLPLPIFLLLYSAQAIGVSGLVLIARHAARTWNGVAAAFVYPFLLTALSFVFTVSSRDGTWGSPGYWQVGFVPLLQIVSVAGLSGLVFAMTLPASAIAVAWYRAWENRPWVLAAGVPLGVFAAILIFGMVRLATSHSGPRVRVGLIATDIHEGYSKTENADKATALIGLYANEIAMAAQQGAQVVVIPEKTVGVTPRDRDAIVQVLSNVAKTSHVWLVVGVNELGRTPMLNTALTFSPDGALINDYQKEHFVRGFEDGYAPGSAIGIVDAPWGRTGVAICKDLDFPRLERRYGAAGVRLLLVPAWDWDGPNAVLHEHMATVRGVENGYAIARAAKDGFVSAHCQYGRPLASSVTYEHDPPTAMVVVDVPLGNGHTVYSRYGDWFGWLSVIVATLIVIRVFLFRKRPPI
jgi:apolipoprotein N-acyltransferase